MGAEVPLALVTGGHRRLGAHVALALAEAGCAIAVHGSHDAQPDEALAAGLAAAGTDWRGFVADFEQPENAAGLMRAVTAHFGREPDILVNSAAMFGQDRLETVTADDLMRHYAVNCAAPVLLTRAFSEASSSAADRCVVNVLDQRLANPHGDQLSYTLGKQALAGFTRIAARELAGKGIRVNAVAPGLTIATEEYDAARMERSAAQMPLRRLPTPEQIAQAVLYLVRAQAVTGQVIAVDAGAHMESFARDFLYL